MVAVGAAGLLALMMVFGLGSGPSHGAETSARAGGPETAVLSLTVTNLASGQGTVYVAIYDRADRFLDPEAKRAAAQVSARQGQVTIRVPGLPPGRYAVAAYHDENDNGRFDQGLLGVPLEGFGFTRDPAVVPTRPSFDDAAIPVTAPETRQTLRMRYAL